MKVMTQAQIAEQFSCPCGCPHKLSQFSVQRHASECLNEHVVFLRTQIRKKTALLKKLEKQTNPDLVKIHQFSKILNDLHAALDNKLHPKDSESRPFNAINGPVGTPLTIENLDKLIAETVRKGQPCLRLTEEPDKLYFRNH
jgi:hypothetical protein